ncbi:hypothetical protein DICSQDRAFT_127220 [Dichomitus squalens LYAD-421 SS1]|uniref:Core Histone H2A/H2B/H3 domain-containing protein n=1 Tax=Dichomitus squalens (strain LYAD-421) TaxID=732165 RepID=R7SYS4_DICSQ|nr:uncharacterized protein DICSQDRAFT_127220 [Dichomitus squalens LYAD-421 SS1]EJF61211.1 hypothetical protein DICSQDRAFT_127220 [Dichomitus squalens LYAD-421 SS1]
MPRRRSARGRSRYVPIFPRAAFDRIVREIAHDMTTDLNGRGNEPLRWQRQAMDAVQEAAEVFLIELLEDALRLRSGRESDEACTANSAPCTLDALPSELRTSSSPAG